MQDIGSSQQPPHYRAAVTRSAALLGHSSPENIMVISPVLGLDGTEFQKLFPKVNGHVSGGGGVRSPREVLPSRPMPPAVLPGEQQPSVQ